MKNFHCVNVPENDDWLQAIYHCEMWILEQWPNLRKARIGDTTWDYTIDFGSNFIIYKFADASKAMMFKLAWGAR